MRKWADRIVEQLSKPVGLHNGAYRLQQKLIDTGAAIDLLAANFGSTHAAWITHRMHETALFALVKVT